MKYKFVMHKPGRRRGIALLLVMIGLVVCTILTAGYLASQGTSLGIARNESDGERARTVAQSGIEMCVWLVKNRSDWREAMQPGAWLSSAAVAGGTVTVNAVDGAGNGSFSTDPRQPVMLTSTGTYNNRTYTLSATITPTGGGTVFGGGNFFSGSVSVGQNSGSSAIVDSYNSAIAPYNFSFPGSNAAVWTNLASSNSVSVYGDSVFRGSVTVAPGSNLGNAVNVQNGATGPSATSAASEIRTAGTIIPPNPANTLTNRGSFVRTGGTTPVSAGGLYSQITLNTSGSTTTMNVNSSGVIHCTGNMTLGSGTVLGVQDGCNVILQVDGSITVNGTVRLYGSGTLTVIANSSITVKNSGTINAPSGTAGTPASCIIEGTANCTQVNVQNSATVSAAIYTPSADVQLSDSGSTPRIFGAVVARSLTITNQGHFHYDEALKSLQVHNAYGGTAPTGVPDYTISMNEGGTLRGSTTPPTVTIQGP